jgi:hypothetical protein
LQETRPLSALEAAASTRLALLGDPGSGKSTFVQRLLAWVASAELDGKELPPGIDSGLLPVLITLRDLAPRLAKVDVDRLPDDRRTEELAAAVRDQLSDDLGRREAHDFADGLRDALGTGRCLLVLDGLDEVPFDTRDRVRKAVSAVIQHYGISRIIVTCRVRSYSGDAVLGGFQTHTLAPFDDDKRRRFAVAWYRAQCDLARMDKQEAESKGNDLAAAATSSELRELSANPMMLTAMAIIHQQEIGLPKQRVRLYDRAVDVLLRRWQKGKVGASGLALSAALGAFLDEDRVVRGAMERLAYEVHRKAASDEVADLPRSAALVLLEEPVYLGDAGLAAEFLDYIDQRAGLLVGRGGDVRHPAVYNLPHRTFTSPAVISSPSVSRGERFTPRRPREISGRWRFSSARRNSSSTAASRKCSSTWPTISVRQLNRRASRIVARCHGPAGWRCSPVDRSSSGTLRPATAGRPSSIGSFGA